MAVDHVAHPSAVKMAEVAMKIYRTVDERAAMRCGMSDAAALCDRLAEELPGTPKGRYYSAKEIAALVTLTATRCGNAIWRMREEITMPVKTRD